MHALLLEHVTGQACSHIVAVGRLKRIPGLKHTGKDNYAWLFKGETIFCLASGPSLMAEICQRVRGRRSIAINLSACWRPGRACCSSRIPAGTSRGASWWRTGMAWRSRSARRG